MSNTRCADRTTPPATVHPHLPRRIVGRGRPLLVLLRLLTRPWSARPRRSDRAQSTVEYALVLLGVAAVALLVVAWATRTQAVGRLLDAVFEQVLGRVR